MIGYGASLSGDERQSLIERLAGSNADAAALGGKALISARCELCHSRARIDDEDEDWDGWSEIVTRMQGYGAQLTAQERETLITHLVATRGDSDHDDSDDDRADDD
jgi:hypothetical protein